MRDYRVTITECSKELTAKEKIMLKDVTDAIKLDKETQTAPVLIDVDFWANLAIHNERSDDKDYNNFIVVDKNGNKYTTGSTSFINSFINIWDEVAEVNEKLDWNLKVYRLPSRNREGKEFITCSIV